MEETGVNKILIQNGTLVEASGNSKEDLLLDNGIIAARGIFGNDVFAGSIRIDAAGKYVMPGGIDPHVHLALPTPAGKSCDDFKSGSMAALSGGTTCFIDFVTPKRGQPLVQALRMRRAEASESLCECSLHMGISEWNPGIAAGIVPLMEKEGIRSFKAYLAYQESIGIGYGALHELMQIVGPAGGLVLVHCEEGNIITGLRQAFLSEGKTKPAFHAATRPAEAEIRAIEQVVELAAKTGCPVYIVHVSTRGGAEVVASAKRSGIKIYAETCPQYLLLDDSVYGMDRADAEVLPFIISPPIRGKRDQDGLWEALAAGTIDVVSTDHCPFNLVGQKDCGINDFSKIPNGAGGIEHRLNLLYTFGVATGRITMNRFVDLVSTRPAEIFGFGNCKGKLLHGYDADIMIWDPECRSVISAATHHSTCDSEIYEGMVTSGSATTVISAGKIFKMS